MEVKWTSYIFMSIKDGNDLLRPHEDIPVKEKVAVFEEVVIKEILYAKQRLLKLE